MHQEGTPNSNGAEGTGCCGPLHALWEDMLRREATLPEGFEPTVSDLATGANTRSTHFAWSERRPLPTQKMIETALATVLSGSNTLPGAGRSATSRSSQCSWR